MDKKIRGIKFSLMRAGGEKAKKILQAKFSSLYGTHAYFKQDNTLYVSTVLLKFYDDRDSIIVFYTRYMYCNL